MNRTTYWTIITMEAFISITLLVLTGMMTGYGITKIVCEFEVYLIPRMILLMFLVGMVFLEISIIAIKETIEEFEEGQELIRRGEL